MMRETRPFSDRSPTEQSPTPESPTTQYRSDYSDSSSAGYTQYRSGDYQSEWSGSTSGAGGTSGYWSGGDR